MPNYEKLYHTLFNKVTKAIENLQQAQIDVEKLYLDMCEEEFPKGEDLENQNED